MTNARQDLERWLRDQKHSRRDEVPTTGHIDDDIIVLLAEGTRRARREELEHLAGCAECRLALGDLMSALPAPAEAPAPWWSVVRRPGFAVASMVATAAAVSLFMMAKPEPVDPWAGYQARGKPAVDAPQVSLLATVEGESVGRPVRDKDSVALDARLGFRYGDLTKQHETLTVLGWDGEVIHWYFPESPGGAAHPIEAGARAERLPFDIDLSQSHHPGRLVVVGAFDVEPAVLAAKLRNGEVPQGAGVSAFRLELVRP